MLLRRLPFLALILSCAPAFAQVSASIPPDVRKAMDQLAKEPFRAHMAFLSDDLLEGRGTGTRGQELAARYIAAQFETLGLEPAGAAGTFYQRVPLREITVVPEKCSVVLTENGNSTSLIWGDDFITGGNASNEDAEVEAPVVFVGYGVTTPDGSYDDYAGADVKGKIIAYLSGAPPSLPSELRAHVGSGLEKARLAVAHGAIGIIGVRPPQADEILPWTRSVIGVRFPSMRWLGPDSQPSDTFPQIRASAGLSTPASARLFQHAPKSWNQVLKDAAASKPQSFALPITAKIHVVSQHRQISSPNVAAVLPGSDASLKNEYVVYSAHSDHLGIGTPINGDSIYNGAFDNASGVAALLVIAQAFKSLPHPPARSIMFLATTAEEKGLLGADYFAEFPTVPRKSLVADLNMDGASVFYAFDEVVALGGPSSSLGGLVERDALLLGVKLIPDPQPEQFGFVRNDEYSFVRRGVPAVSLEEGFHAKDPKVDGKKLADDYIRLHYHAPSDDMSQHFDFNASVQFMQINFLVGYDVAQSPQRPTWNSSDFFGKTFGNR
ncbi:MAG TPA: M28 family metallopeptidase [Candidatus Methylomirabilis sp.]|nr:M28 family metallopeptidase [Candidatus Methylomirabilis sp.]